MKCTICGNFYNVKTYPRCDKCFPEVKKQQEKEKMEKNIEAFNQGQLSMVYGESEK